MLYKRKVYREIVSRVTGAQKLEKLLGSFTLFDNENYGGIVRKLHKFRRLIYLQSYFN